MKHSNTAQVGDVIRALDFQGQPYYIQGRVLKKGAVHTRSGVYLYDGYHISIEQDTLGEGSRVGDIGYVPFETALDYEDRVQRVESTA